MNQHTPDISCRGVACNALAPTKRDARIVSNVVAARFGRCTQRTYTNISPNIR